MIVSFSIQCDAFREASDRSVIDPLELLRRVCVLVLGASVVKVNERILAAGVRQSGDGETRAAPAELDDFAFEESGFVCHGSPLCSLIT